MSKISAVATLALALMLLPSPVAAYVGPGAALSLLGAFWGMIVAIGAAVAFAVAWPVRRYLHQRRQRAAGAPGASASSATHAATPVTRAAAPVRRPAAPHPASEA